MINCCRREPPKSLTLRQKFWAWCRRIRLRWHWFLLDIGVRKYHLPKINKVFPKLDAKDIVNVQPMGGPTGLIIQMKEKYK